ADFAPGSRYDTGRYRPTKAERIADCQNPLADADWIFREFDERERLTGRHLQQGEIGSVVFADQLGVILRAILGGDGEGVGVVNDMIVRNQIAIVGNEETRTKRCSRLRRLAWLLRHLLEKTAHLRRKVAKPREGLG